MNKVIQLYAIKLVCKNIRSARVLGNLKAKIISAALATYMVFSPLAVMAKETQPVNTGVNAVKIDKKVEEKIELNVSGKDKPVIKTSKPIEKVDSKLFEEADQEKMQQLFQIQKKADVSDIESLWTATVEKNTVIRFALKKLAMPAEQRRIHSSIMAKTLSTFISGATILPSLFGADTFTSSAAYAGGGLVNRAIKNKTMPKEMPLTDTELIQLAKLVEDLQNKLIKNYYSYKTSIENLKACRENLILQNKNYAKAIEANNEISMIAASALYDKELSKELELKQNLKLARLELERMTGSEAVDKLSLTKISDVNLKELDKAKQNSNKTSLNSN